jgi:aryl-alcohol dehydrogenase-like predicted oxidoreductase
MKQAGLIRAIGMSTKTVAGGLEALKRSDVAMVTYNLKQDDERPVIDHAAAHHKGILIKKAFASGHLADDQPDPVQASLNKVLGTAGVSAVIAGTVNPHSLYATVRSGPGPSTPTSLFLKTCRETIQAGPARERVAYSHPAGFQRLPLFSAFRLF